MALVDQNFPAKQAVVEEVLAAAAAVEEALVVVVVEEVLVVVVADPLPRAPLRPLWDLHPRWAPQWLAWVDHVLLALQ